MNVLLISLLSFFLPQKADKTSKDISPLSKYSTEWNAAKYKACNTAANANYMSAEEKEVIYILNLARTNPKLFCETVVKPRCAEGFADVNSEKYYGSLVKQMMSMSALGLLKPDQVSYNSARCHAETAGKEGYTGHKRLTEQCRKLQKYYGECCSYGMSAPVNVVLQLLVDEDVESLGHREICLGSYTKIGVAQRPHAGFSTNTVLDFAF